MTTTDNAKRLLSELVNRLDTQTIAQFCRKRLFAEGVELPMMKWSTLNQIACFLSGTVDARGIDQWRRVGRWPKKGSKAIYILVPMFRTVSRQNSERDEGEPESVEDQERKILSGFRCLPVFRFEDTEGKDLDYQQTMKEFDPSKFPLYQVALSMGVTVHAGLTFNAYGYFEQHDKTITLGTDDVTTFMHELSHAVDAVLPGKSDDYNYNEVVAELSSCFLCTLYGLPHHEQHTKAYIEQYQGRSPVAFKIANAVDRVLEIYSYIAKYSEADQQKAAQ